MADDAVRNWFRSGKYAQVNGTRLRPVPHPLINDEVLSMQKGQAECLCLVADNGGKFILKKFHRGKELDLNYLVSASRLLPRTDGFIAGTQRQILSPDKLVKASKCYYAKGLAAFLKDTILMHR